MIAPLGCWICKYTYIPTFLSTSIREHPKGAIIGTCDIWDTDHNTDNWEPGFMTIFVTWQSIVTLDSIRNSCDVLPIFGISSELSATTYVDLQEHRDGWVMFLWAICPSVYVSLVSAKISLFCITLLSQVLRSNKVCYYLVTDFRPHLSS